MRSRFVLPAVVSLILIAVFVSAPFARAGEAVKVGDLDESCESVVPLVSTTPVAGGYKVLDQTDPGGPAFNWVDIRVTGTPVALADDNSLGPFGIGFTFPFYGVGQNQFFIGSNGFLSFGAGSPTYYNQCALPQGPGPNNLIALMWDDLDPFDSGDLAYFQSFASCPVGSGPCLVVQYQNFHHFPGGPTATVAGTFEAILFEGGNILVQFLDTGDEQGLGSTTGIENLNGSAGLTYACNSASLLDGTAVLFTRSEWRGNPATPFEYTRFDCAWFDDGSGPTAWNRKIYCPGGRVGSPTESPDIWRFDPLTGIWEDTGHDVSEDVGNYTANLLVDENYGADGLGIYLVGGTDADTSGSPVTRVQRYYPKTGRSEAMLTDPWPGSLAGNVTIPGACVSDSEHSRIYCFGGYENLAPPYNTVAAYEYDPLAAAGARWTAIAPLAWPRGYIQAAVSGGIIYAMGGDVYDGADLTPSFLVESLDLANKAAGWQIRQYLPVPVGEGRAVAVGGKIYVTGGGDWPGEGNEVMVYDTASDSWDQSAGDLNWARRNHAMTYVPLVTPDPLDGTPGLWVFGGRHNSDLAPFAPPEHLPLPPVFLDTFSDGDAFWGDREWATYSGLWKVLTPAWHPDPIFAATSKTARALAAPADLTVTDGVIDFSFKIGGTSARKSVKFVFDSPAPALSRFVQLKQLASGAWKIFLRQKGAFDGDVTRTVGSLRLTGFRAKDPHDLTIRMYAGGRVQVELDGVQVLDGAFAGGPTGGAVGLATDRTQLWVDDYTVYDGSILP